MAIAKKVVRLDQGNVARLQRLKRAVAKLPPLEAALWRKRVQKKLASGPLVVGGEWGETTPTDGTGEWDLELANWLDSTYTIVSDRAGQVYANVKDGAENLAKSAGNVASSVGFGLWPIAIAAVAVMWAFGNAKRA